MFLRVMMGPRIDTPLCGVERVRKLNERSGSGAAKLRSGAGAERERSVKNTVEGAKW